MLVVGLLVSGACRVVLVIELVLVALVEMIDDPDQNIVLRVTNKGTQKATFVQKDADGNELKQEFALSGLTLEPAPEEPEG